MKVKDTVTPEGVRYVNARNGYDLQYHGKAIGRIVRALVGWKVYTVACGFRSMCWDVTFKTRGAGALYCLNVWKNQPNPLENLPANSYRKVRGG